MINRYVDKEWEYLQEPFQMAPKVYYVGTTYVGSYLIETTGGLILIDQLFAESVYMLFESIRKLGFDPKDIKLLLLSHGHFDHCGGTRLVKEYTKAPVYMAEEDDRMKQEHTEWVHFGYQNWIDFAVDAHYRDDKPIKLGDITIQTIHTPGHTPGTTSFFFETKDQKGKSYRCGLHGGIGLNTLVPSYYAEQPLWPKDMPEKFKASLERLLLEKVDIPLPSHPNQISILDKAGAYNEDNNPFVNPAAWTQLLNDRMKMVMDLMSSSGDGKKA